MLIEVRKLIFSDDLLQTALLKQCATQGIEVPNSQIQKVKVYGAGAAQAPIKIIMQFMSANPNKPIDVTLREDVVLTALIAMCKRFNVPLPRNAAKTLQLTNQGLAMVVSMSMNKPMN